MSIELRLVKLEQAHMRWRLQRMSDQELLAILSEEGKAQWRDAGVGEAEMLRRTRAVLKSWGYV